MNKFLTVITLFLVLGTIFYFSKKNFIALPKSTPDDLPFKKKEFLMNIPERKFLEELTKIIPSNYVVLPQVVLSSIVETTAPKSKSISWINKINRKTVDYVIFELPYYKPVIAVEYDGKTHSYPSRKERDQEVGNILDVSGIKNFHVSHSNNIDLEEIKNKINEILVDKNR